MNQVKNSENPRWRLQKRVRQIPKTGIRNGIIISVCAVITFGVFFIYFNTGTPKQAYAQRIQSQGPLSPSTFGVTAISGSKTGWSNVSNIASSNDVYATNTVNLPNNNDYSNYMVATNFGFTISPYSTIYGIKVEIERADVSAKAKDYRVRLVKNGVITATDRLITSSWHNTDEILQYGDTTDLWGNTWTYSDINAGNFGVALAIARSGGGVSPVLAKVDVIMITVFYNYSPLPVQLLSFDAKPGEGKVKCTWQTASEKNNDYFTVERTPDGTHFTEAGKVKGSGNTTAIKEYEFTDMHPFKGKSYYRLRQTDYNNKTQTFKMVAVTVEAPGKNESFAAKIFPNPFSDVLNAEFELAQGEELEFQLLTLSGAKIWSEKRMAETGNNRIQLTPPDIESRTYLLRINNSGSTILQGTKVTCKRN